jgi:hypothetical protein
MAVFAWLNRKTGPSAHIRFSLRSNSNSIVSQGLCLPFAGTSTLSRPNFNILTSRWIVREFLKALTGQIFTKCWTQFDPSRPSVIKEQVFTSQNKTTPILLSTQISISGKSGDSSFNLPKPTLCVANHFIFNTILIVKIKPGARFVIPVGMRFIARSNNFCL